MSSKLTLDRFSKKLRQNASRLTLTIALASASIVANPVFAAPYSQYTVNGNYQISDNVILGTAGLVPGVPIGEAELNAALERLYASGLFSDVEFVRSDSFVTIIVSENPFVNQVFFEGNDRLKDEELANIVSMKPRSGLDAIRVDTDVQLIKQIYAQESFFDVDVRPVVIKQSAGTVNLVYEINEGKISEVERVTFIGNESVEDDALRGVVETREAGSLSPIFKRDNFRQQVLADDKVALVDYYQNNGFYDATVIASGADIGRGGDFYVSYTIQEGVRYRISDSVITSAQTGVNPAIFAADNAIKTGQYYSRDQVRDTIEAIENRAADMGMPFLRATPIITRDEANGTLNVEIQLSNGQRQYVERIDIHGNSTTLDRVIRRQFEFAEGDPLNARKLAEAEKRIQALGYFETVKIQPREGTSGDSTIIDVEVAEGNTGRASFGANYDPNAGAAVFLDVTLRNFLGRGQTVAGAVSIGQLAQSATFSFAEPGLFDRDLLGGFRVYYNNTDRPESVFQSTSFGFEPRIAFPVSKDSRLSLNYFVDYNNIREVSDETSPLIRIDEGQRLSSGFGASYTIDKLNNRIEPTRGYIARVSGKLAGIGGDSSWGSIEAKARVYYPIFRDDVVFSLEGEGGMIESFDDNHIRVSDRYFLGGSSLKGYAAGGIGPRDKAGSIDSALGGNKFAAARALVKFPLGLPDEAGIKGGLFWEMGSVWDLDIVEGGASGTVDDELYWRGSYGASIFWDTPLGALQFNWAQPYNERTGDKTQIFSVSASTNF